MGTHKHAGPQRTFFNPCMGSSLSDAMLMIAVVEMIFAAAFLIHGGYLCNRRYDVYYGVPYIICGILYLFLSPLLWRSVKQPKPGTGYFTSSIFFLVLAQLIAVAATISRNVIYRKFIWSINIWIICGLFIQCYIIWIVYSFMRHGDEEDNPVFPEPGQDENNESNPSEPPPASASPEDENEDDTVIIESSNNSVKNGNKPESEPLPPVPEAIVVNKTDNSTTSPPAAATAEEVVSVQVETEPKNESENGVKLDKQGTPV